MKRKVFRSKLLRKYRLTIHNENKLENVLGFYISPLWVILSLFFSFLLVAGVLYLIIVFTPVDSLLRKVEIQDMYIANIRSIMNGDIVLDSIKNSPAPVSKEELSTDATEREKQFAKQWEERERYNLTSQATSIAALQEINIFRPTRGDIIEQFDPSKGHFGVDIAEIHGESIVSIHDGIVVFSDYTANDGYTMVIQHRENLISVYRNCYRLLKEVGDKVYAGEAIGTLSDGTGKADRSEKEFLHLELWHRSRPIDPSIYIAF